MDPAGLQIATLHRINALLLISSTGEKQFHTRTCFTKTRGRVFRKGSEDEDPTDNDRR